MKCGSCQQNTIANSAAPLRSMLPCDAVQPISAGSAPGTRADDRRQRRAPLHRRVDRRDRSTASPAPAPPTASSRAPASSASPAADSTTPKIARVGRREAAGRQRPHPRPPHQRVGVAFVELIQHRRAGGDQRRPGHGFGHREQRRSRRSRRGSSRRRWSRRRGSSAAAW